MASFWDEGPVSSVYHLQQVAKTSGDAGFIARAAALQTRLEAMTLPTFQSPFILGDALQLGYELAAATSTGSTSAPSVGLFTYLPVAKELWFNGGSPNVLFDEDSTIGGVVGTPTQEAVEGGDVLANVKELGQDLSKSSSTVFKNYGAPVASKAKYFAYALIALVVLLLFFYTYESARA